MCGEGGCSINDTNQCGTCRYQLASPPPEADIRSSDHARGIDAAFARIFAKRRRQEVERTPQPTPPPHISNDTETMPTNTHHAPIARWDDEDATADLPSDSGDPEDDHTNEGPPNNPHRRKQPIAIRARIIRLNRIAQATRKRQIGLDRNRAIRMLATFNATTEASAPLTGIGKGHRTYAVGPILFCRICGATKSRSTGSRLARPCRGWAPPGTRATISARLQGRNYAFYKGMTRHLMSVTPVGNRASSAAGDPTPPPVARIPTPTTRPISITRMTEVNAHIPRSRSALPATQPSLGHRTGQRSAARHCHRRRATRWSSSHPPHTSLTMGAKV